MGDLSLLPGTRRALLHRLAIAQVEGRAPGMVAGVVRGGELVWFDGCGEIGGAPPDQDVAFMIGSITKTFTAVLVMRLRDAGRAALREILTHVRETGDCWIATRGELAATVR